MRKCSWKVEWRANPRPDGVERLGQAVRLLLERAAKENSKSREQQKELQLRESTSAEAER